MKKAVMMTMAIAALSLGALVGCEDKAAKPATPTPPAGGAKTPAPAPTPPAGGAKPSGG